VGFLCGAWPLHHAHDVRAWRGRLRRRTRPRVEAVRAASGQGLSDLPGGEEADIYGDGRPGVSRCGRAADIAGLIASDYSAEQEGHADLLDGRLGGWLHRRPRGRV